MGEYGLRGPAVAGVVAVSAAVFGVASVIAATDYPSWMWAFVVAGLVVPPLVALLALGSWALRRLGRS